MITKAYILKKLTELKPELHKDYSVSKIGLFGSFSDNTFNEDSDIDILVELERPIGWKFFSLELFLEKTFNRKNSSCRKSKSSAFKPDLMMF